ncbi:transmembrane protein 179B isoform X1 [Xiphophorus couchianus]|uniref:transmembrane protein 179B isoform X1 n=1 Tax=Xiphophorus couchianus TaxID=32473 RepID=UPI001016DE24|nr:transmembrane protein 179B isoform X1 [Xiphophorus couchianus]XP_027894750.1 transmembrane protein 179B isoform X1 [Xiphophorus couchianus]
MMTVSVLLVLELSLYTCCFVCGIVAAASLTIVQGNFGGLCMLYGRVSYNATGSVVGVQASTSASLCYFVSAISIMVAVVCFSLSVYWVYAFCMEGEMRRERLWLNVMVFVSGIFLFFLLITGCMLKIGRDSLCASILRTVTDVKRCSPFPPLVRNQTGCDEVQSKNWVSPLQGTRIYTNLHKSETAVWVNFFFWIIIGALVIVQKRQSSGAKSVPTPAGSLFGEPGATAAETEPFFNRPPRPQ